MSSVGMTVHGAEYQGQWKSQKVLRDGQTHDLFQYCSTQNYPLYSTLSMQLLDYTKIGGTCNWVKILNSTSFICSCSC